MSAMPAAAIEQTIELLKADRRFQVRTSQRADRQSALLLGSSV